MVLTILKMSQKYLKNNGIERREGGTMNSAILRIFIFTLGFIIIAVQFILELDGTPGLLLTMLGVFLVLVGLTYKGIVKFLAEIF